MCLASERATMVRGEDVRGRAWRTEIAQLKRELARQRHTTDSLTQAVEQFTSDLAHDLKNPLGAMRVSIQALKRAIENGRTLEREYLIERLERIERSIDQALGVLANRRGKLDGGTSPQPQRRREPVDLVALVQVQVNELEAAVGARRIQLEPSCSELVGNWDSERVARTVRELLDNALKFSGVTDRVRVVVRHHTSQNLAELQVIDRGIGIPSQDLGHVSERFYRADNVVGRFKGAGLGLFEASRCAADHGGALAIESEAGRGCTCTLRLPLHMQP